jgi:hypothetical protein
MPESICGLQQIGGAQHGMLTASHTCSISCCMTGPAPNYPLPPERNCRNYEHACVQATAPLQLYDTWVTRDAAGRHASKLPPYLQYPAGKTGFRV